MPDHVREALEPYFPEPLLEEVRWNLPGRRLSLGSFLTGWYFKEGAVTLGDVIVFSDRELANNVWFWAHELGHVEQYRRLGVDGFARAYLSDWRAMEAEATLRADRIGEALRQAKAARDAAAASPLAEAVVQAPAPAPAAPP